MPDAFEGHLILALDGHDGSGKTTLARRLAKTMSVPYVRPFTGAGGQRLLNDAAAGRFGEVSHAAKGMVNDALALVPDPVVVFDRHWMTVFTLVDESWWHEWMPLPPTLLCWIDLGTTLQRLGARDEPPSAIEEHRRYLAAYRELAARFDCETVRTDLLGEDEAFAFALVWAERSVARVGAPP